MLGRYRLLSLLATGGMGEVFLARQEGPIETAQLVVVKRILRHLAQDQGFIDQFVNEARLAALLKHPNIARVYGLEREAGTWFMAMEYVHGRPLRVVIDECRRKGLKVPVRVAVRLCSQVLQGLHAAHELTDENGALLGILHRDVTPENILVSFSGQTKLVDFGIAKAMNHATMRRRPPWGKLPYMAPELIRQLTPADRRADVYALGVVMHELITLAKPPNVQSSVETLSVPTTAYEPKGALPRALDDILAKALALEPNDRWASAALMSQALETWLSTAGQTVVASDVHLFLVDVFGSSAVGQHDSGAVAHLGTAPLGTAPLSSLNSGQLSLPPSTSWSLKAQTRAVLGVGVATALVLVVVALIAIVGGPGDAAQTDAGSTRSADTEAIAVKLPNDDDATSDAKAPRRRVQRTGKVVFKVNPGVEVFMGGRLLGVTPLKTHRVPVGTVTFTLKQAKVTRRVSVTVPPGGTVQLKADLKK